MTRWGSPKARHASSASGWPEAAINDLILLNEGNGKSYSAYELPSSHGGGPDSVYAFDHDGNGMTDFLALNGGWTGVPGPIELFAFYPR